MHGRVYVYLLFFFHSNLLFPFFFSSPSFLLISAQPDTLQYYMMRVNSPTQYMNGENRMEGEIVVLPVEQQRANDVNTGIVDHDGGGGVVPPPAPPSADS